MEFHTASAPQPSGTSQGICTGTLQNLTKHLLPPEPHKVSAPEPSGTSQGICPGIFAEPHHTSSARPSGTSSGSCTGNFRNLTRYLHQNALEPNQLSAPNPPEPHRVPAPETSGTSQGICTGTLNPPEPQQVSSPEPSGTPQGICTGTLRNLVRNLVLKLHRVAPELVWAKDPIAKLNISPYFTPASGCRQGAPNWLSVREATCKERQSAAVQPLDFSHKKNGATADGRTIINHH